MGLFNSDNRPGLIRLGVLFVKSAILNFARTARVLTGRYMCDLCERGAASSPNVQPRANARFTGLTTVPFVARAVRSESK